MPRTKANLPAARAKNHAPVAPPDLWEQIDREVAAYSATPPPGSFTVKEFATRYGMTIGAASHQTQRLINEGLIEDVGRYGDRRARYFKVLTQ